MCNSVLKGVHVDTEGVQGVRRGVHARCDLVAG